MDEKYSDYDHAIRRWHGLHVRGDEIRDPKNLIAMRRGFAALAHYVDDKIGELLEVLEDSGLRDDTIVIFTSDHGEMLGEKGMIQKRSLYEWSARIPLFIDIPGVEPRTINTLCTLYTSDAADDLHCVDLGGRRINKKKKTQEINQQSHHIHVTHTAQTINTSSNHIHNHKTIHKYTIQTNKP